MIIVYTGPMFSGKSAKLIDIYNSYKEDDIIALKPSKDKRDGTFLKSRDREHKVPAKIIENFSQIKDFIKDNNIKNIIIDEAQFIQGDVDIIKELSNKGYNFYIGGLELTSEQTNFGKMKDIINIANKVEYFTAICYKCKEPAQYTICEVDKVDDILVGSSEYKPICKKCLERRV